MKRLTAVLIILAALFFCQTAMADELWAIMIDGATYSNEQLDAGASGLGWSWSADNQELTLSGYNGKDIVCNSINVNLNIALAPGSVNTIDGSLYAYDGLSIKGGGVLNADSVNTQQYFTAESCEINADGGSVGSSSYPTAMTDCRITVKNSRSGIDCREKVTLTRCDIEVESCEYMVVAAMGLTATDCSFSASKISKKLVFCEGWSQINSGANLTNCRVRARDCEDGFEIDDAPCAFNECEMDMVLSGGGIRAKSIALAHSDMDITCYGKYGFASSYVRLDGGNNLTLSCDRYAIETSGKVVLSNSDRADLCGAIEAIRVPIDKEKAILIDGSSVAYPAGLNHITIDGGRISNTDRRTFALKIGGNRIPDDKLSGTLSGPGWTWNPEGVITLTGYSGENIALSADKARLICNGKNEVPEMALYGDITIEGDGEISGHKYEGDFLTLESGVFEYYGIEAHTGEIRIEAGELSGYNVYCRRFIINGGEAKLSKGQNGLTATGGIKVAGGKLFAREKINCGADVEMTGGELDSDSPIITHNKGGVSITGGTVNMNCEDKAIEASGNILIGGTANATICSAVAALTGSKVTIGGVPFTGSDSVEIKDGKLARSFSRVPSIEIDSHQIFSDQISQNLSGDDWSWTAKNKTLTLKGDKIRMVSVNIPGVTITPDKVFGSPDFFPAIQPKYYITFKGPGIMYFSTNSSGSYAIAGGLEAHLERVYSWCEIQKPISITDSTVYANEVETADGLVIKNSRLFIDGAIEVIEAAMNASSSVISVSCREYAATDVYVDGKLTLKNSALIFSNEVMFRRSSISGTALFKREMVEGQNVCVLIQSAKTGAKITLPEGVYYIPRGVTLNAKKKLVIPGTLIVDGKIKGKVKCDDITGKSLDAGEYKTEVVTDIEIR
ncbi:MAG: hypothetical protein Q4D04_06545 [Clostridia bacterium]|nr:hypothetical protein [Clostridia bacterium]